VTPVVGTTIQPGERTTLTYPYAMSAGMGGPHHFEITLRTDSPETPTLILHLKALSG
jgi:hypothetical protein